MSPRRLLLSVLIALAAGLTSTGAALAAGPPAVTTLGPTEVTPTSATLRATASPNGLATTVAFDYGTSTAYGTTSETAPAGDGTVPVDVAVAITGLRAGTTYHLRARAANSAGTDSGADVSFTTPSAPVVSTGAASAVTLTDATLSASVDPKGQTTSVVFDVGTTTAYGTTTPAQDAGGGRGAKTLTAVLGMLQPGTTYHYRARAANATGSVNGGDRTFKTRSAPVPSATTTGAAAVGSTQATLLAAVDPNGRETSAVIEYGTSTAYGQQSAPLSAGSGDAAVPLRFTITGLRPLTTYHFRVLATSDAGRDPGADRTFRTGRPASVAGLNASPNPVAYLQPVTLTGQVGGTGAAGSAVTLLGSPQPFGSPFTPIATATADAAGAFSATLRLRQTTRVQVRAAAGGDVVTSSSVRVNVAPRISTRVQRLRGARVRMLGTIRPGGAATVSLRKVVNGRIVTVRRVRVRGTGATATPYRFTLTAPRRPGRYLVHVKPARRDLVAGDGTVRTLQRR